MSPNKQEKYDWLFICLESFSRSYYLSHLINKHLGILDAHSGALVPHLHICNTLTADCSIKWSMVFGMDDEKLHWKNIAKDKAEFKGELLSTVGISDGEYTEVWKDMKALRDTAVSHFDFTHVGVQVPHFSIPLKCACVAHNYFTKQASLDGINKELIDLDEFGRASAESYFFALKIQEFIDFDI